METPGCHNAGGHDQILLCSGIREALSERRQGLLDKDLRTLEPLEMEAAQPGLLKEAQEILSLPGSQAAATGDLVAIPLQ